MTERSRSFRVGAAVHARASCQWPPRPLLMAETGVWASCASLAHVSLMAASTPVGELMLGNVDADVVEAKLRAIHPGRTGNGVMFPVERHTHGHALSVPFNRDHQCMACSPWVYGLFLLGVTPSTSTAALHSLRGSPQRANCAQEAEPIEFYLVTARTGQPATQGGHSRAH